MRRQTRIHQGARAAKRARRRACERLGSDRYSHPAYDDLDRKLFAYLPERGGTFVEAGAFDGYWGSNTYWFERFRGWSGVLIEPLPELAERAHAERPRSRVIQCALVPPDYAQESIELRYGGLMSVIAGTWDGDEEAHARSGANMQGSDTFVLRVPARQLSRVLDEASITDIDLLVLDVEGFEPQALSGLDLRRHRPRFLLIEMLRESEERSVIETMLGAGYQAEARLTDRDYLYRRVVS